MEGKKIPIVVTEEEERAYNWICIANRRADFVLYLKQTRATAGRQLTYEAFGHCRGRNESQLTRWVRASAVTFMKLSQEPLPTKESAAGF